MNTITIQTKTRTHFIDITNDVQQFVTENKLINGTITLFVPHTTAGITINENADPDVLTDLDTILAQIIPWKNTYHHAEGNSAAHAKASLMGASLQILIENGRLCLGTWQSLFFCEFDGPRTRQLWLKECRS